MSDFDYKKSSYNYYVLRNAGKASGYDNEAMIEDLKKDFPILTVDSLAPVGIYIMDFKNNTIPYMSKSFETITGYPPELLYREGFNFLINVMHPDDLPITFNPLTRMLFEKIKTLRIDMINRYRFSFNYRILRSDGKYIHVLQQTSAVYADAELNPILTVGTLTDISFLKKDNSIMLQVSKYDPKKRIWKETEVLMNTASNPLTVRESQILRALADEKSNEEIAELCDISVNTVRAHRRNILTNTKCKKMTSAISLAHREGWI